MHIQTFATRLLVLLLTLQLLSYLILYFSYMKFGVKGLLGGLVVYVIIALIALKITSDVEVYSDYGVKKTLKDVIGDVFAIVGILALQSFVIIILGVTAGISGPSPRTIPILIPFLSIAVFYTSFILPAKYEQK